MTTAAYAGGSVACTTSPTSAPAAPRNDADCTAAADCPGAWFCDAGACVPGCAGDADCAAFEECRSFTCVAPLCGNGAIDSGEACDSGSGNADNSACTSQCLLNVCGDGRVWSGVEACDDGNLTDGDGCDHDCSPTGCGNGIVTRGERCDDGNLTDGDGCDQGCSPTGCGNGVITAPEECDDANHADGDGCDSNCTLTRCGNGIATAGEECDDGNGDAFDGCLSTCAPRFCRGGADTDHDGVPDRCDACPGVDDFDSALGDVDFDRLCGTADNCGRAFNPTQADRDHDGHGDACELTDTSRVQRLTQASAGGSIETADGFGKALALGDFDNDGRADLAVGAPGEDSNAGAVSLFRGSATGLTGGRTLTLSDFGETPAASDAFGASFAVGDLDGDGFADLVIGTRGRASSRGALVVAWGGPTGLTPRAGALDAAALGCGPAAANEQLAFALATADFDQDGRDEMVIGIPGRASFAGAVCVASASKRTFGTASVYVENSGGTPEMPEANDSFGTSLAVGRFNGDTYLDLAVGAPGETVNSSGPFQGAVVLLFGAPGTVALNHGVVLTQEDAANLSEPMDFCGMAVTAGDTNGDAIDELLMGCPGEALGATRSGAAYLFPGTTFGPGEGWPVLQAGVPGSADEASDLFAVVLGAADSNGDGQSELFVGATGKKVSGAAGAGAVLAYAVVAPGVMAGERFDRTRLSETPTASDSFGAALAMADIHGDGAVDVAVAAPNESPDTAPAGGAVYVLMGVAR